MVAKPMTVYRRAESSAADRGELTRVDGEGVPCLVQKCDWSTTALAWKVWLFDGRQLLLAPEQVCDRSAGKAAALEAARRWIERYSYRYFPSGG